MKKIIFLLMFLLGYSLLTSQVTNTTLTKDQVDQIYKGLKQGEYLKVRVSKLEETLDKANGIIDLQNTTNIKLTSALSLSEQVTATNQEVYTQEKKILDLKYDTLNNNFEIFKIQAKKDKRHSLWKGIKIGGITVGVLGAAALFLLR